MKWEIRNNLRMNFHISNSYTGGWEYFSCKNCLKAWIFEKKVNPKSYTELKKHARTHKSLKKPKK